MCAGTWPPSGLALCSAAGPTCQHPGPAHLWRARPGASPSHARGPSPPTPGTLRRSSTGPHRGVLRPRPTRCRHDSRGPRHRRLPRSSARDSLTQNSDHAHRAAGGRVLAFRRVKPGSAQSGWCLPVQDQPLGRDGEWKGRKPICTAANATAARAAWEDLTEKWGPRYGAIIRLWNNAWEEHVGVPGLRRGDPHRALVDECDRVAERPLSSRGQGQGALPDRASSDEVPVSGHQVTPPDRARQDTMDHEAEDSAQRVRDHLRRLLASSRDLLMKTAGNTVTEVVDVHDG